MRQWLSAICGHTTDLANQAVSDKAFSDKAVSDKAFSDKAFSDQSLSDQSLAGQVVSDQDLDQFDECIVQMRRTIDSLHFGLAPDLQWLDLQLADLKLRVSYESFLPLHVREVLPLLHAQVQDTSAHYLLKALTQTLLLQFAEFVDRALADDQAPSIARCEGIFRENSSKNLSQVNPYLKIAKKNGVLK